MSSIEFDKLTIRNMRMQENKHTADSEMDFRNIPRPLSSVAYFLKGRMDFCEDDRVIHAKPDDIVFVPFGARYRLHCTEDSEFLSFYFSMELFGNKTQKYWVERLDGCGLKRDFEFLYDNMKDGEISLDVFAGAYKILSAIRPKLTVVELEPIDNRICIARDWIDAHFAEPIPMNELAQKCGLSKSHFFALFSKYMNMTPIEYKKRSAILHSQIMLSNSVLSVEEISADVGFHSANYFCRVFRQVVGMTPSEYRSIISAL